MSDLGRDEDADTNRKEEIEDVNLEEKTASVFIDIGEEPMKTSILLQRKISEDLRRRRVSHDDNSFRGRLLTICCNTAHLNPFPDDKILDCSNLKEAADEKSNPAKKLVFTLEEGVKKTCSTIILKNTLPYSIAYKVKTTSPTKFKVKSVFGYVRPGSDEEVRIYMYINNGNQNTLQKDKFLIMAMEVTNESNTSLADLWKNVQKESIMEHKLSCVVLNSKEGKCNDRGQMGLRKNANVAELSKQVDTLKRSVNQLLYFIEVLLTLLLGLVCFALYTYFYNDNP